MLNKVFSLVIFALVGCVFLAFTNSNDSAVSVSNASFAAKPAAEQVTVKWYTWEEAVKASATEKRKIFIDIYTDWCGWCKRMDKNTFRHQSIAKYLNKDFYAVKLNAEQKADIKFRNHTFKFVSQGRRGYHQLAYELMNGRMSYPTIVVLNEDYQRILISPGYQTATDFEPVLRFASENHYKTKTWKNFLAENKK